MRDVVVYLARALVDEPDRVTVEELPGARGVTYEVRTAPEDVGKLIGRGGRTVKSLRRVVKAAAPRGQRGEVEGLAEGELRGPPRGRRGPPPGSLRTAWSWAGCSAPTASRASSRSRSSPTPPSGSPPGRSWAWWTPTAPSPREPTRAPPPPATRAGRRS